MQRWQHLGKLWLSNLSALLLCYRQPRWKTWSSRAGTSVEQPSPSYTPVCDEGLDADKNLEFSGASSATSGVLFQALEPLLSPREPNEVADLLEPLKLTAEQRLMLLRQFLRGGWQSR